MTGTSRSSLPWSLDRRTDAVAPSSLPRMSASDGRQPPGRTRRRSTRASPLPGTQSRAGRRPREIPADYIRRRCAPSTDGATSRWTDEGGRRSAYRARVACAMGSRIGVGGGTFHWAGERARSTRSTWGRSGAAPWSGRRLRRALHAHQDWHLNLRLRQTVGRVVHPRHGGDLPSSIEHKALARQYFQYGQWRRVGPASTGTGTRLPRASGDGGGHDRGHRAGNVLAPALLVPTAYLAGVVIGGAGISGGEPLRHGPSPRGPGHDALVVGLRVPHHPRGRSRGGRRCGSHAVWTGVATEPASCVKRAPGGDGHTVHIIGRAVPSGLEPGRASPSLGRAAARR